MKLNEIRVKDYQSAAILNESWQQLTEAQQIYVGRWETSVWPLVEQYSRLLEQELTPAQIQKIFTSAEQVAKATGKNTTALGKAGKVTAEVTGKMKAEIEKLMKAAQDSGPIKNADAQFDKLRTQLAAKLKGNPAGQKILSGVDKWKTFAEENPAKSAFIIGAMTSILAFASGGVVSGAAIGFFLRLANNTIKGDKLSTAVGSAVKTAAIGAVAGAIGGAMDFDAETPEVEGGDAEVTSSIDGDSADYGADGLPDTVDEYKRAYAYAILEQRVEDFGGEIDQAMVDKIAENISVSGNYPDNFNAEFDGTFVRGTVYLTPEEAQEYSRIVQANGGGMQGHFSEEANKFIQEAGGKGPNVVPDGGTDPETGANEPEDSNDTSTETSPGYTSENGIEYTDEDINNLIDQAKEQGVVPADLIGDLVDSKDVDAGIYSDEVSMLELTLKELGYDPLKIPESIEEQLWNALDAYELREAPNFMAALGGAAKGLGKVASKGADIVGKAAAKGAAKAGQAAKSVGNELGNIVTAKKLNRLWNKAGKPTDMGSIVNILNQAGVSDEQIGTVGKQARVDLSKPRGANEVDPKLQALANQIKDLGLVDVLKPELADG